MSVLFGLLMNFMASMYTKIFLHAAFKIAITVAFIALVVSAIYAYVSSFSTIISALGATMPTIVSGVWGWVMPHNTNACIFAIFSCIMLRFITKQYLLLMNHRFRAAISN
ncbi:MAG: DUF5455 family protein [Methylococcales bacterium]|nr:DUF5455 family protein [Methylococcales bacterium]